MNEAMNENQSRAQRRRPRRLAGVVFALGAAMLLFHGVVTDYARGLSAPDGVYIPSPTHKFSKQEARGGVLSHTFRIYNLCPRRLTVQAEPYCGCTGVSWQRATIPPFGWKELTAKMEAKTSALSQQQSVGIALHTDSRDQPFVFAFLVQ